PLACSLRRRRPGLSLVDQGWTVCLRGLDHREDSLAGSRVTGFVSGRTHEREGLPVRQYLWLARSGPIRLLLLSWFLSYAGDLAAFTAASVYVYRVGGAAYVGLLGLLKALPGALLVPLVASWSDRVRRERLLAVSVTLRALLLGAAAAVMTGGVNAI